MGEAAKPPRTGWKVSGARIDTGEDVTLYVEARGREAAERFVGKQGILVSSVEPVAPGAAAPPAEVLTTDDALDPGVHIGSVSPGAAFQFGFYAFLGGLAAWFVVAVIVWVAVVAITGRFP